MWIGTFNHSPYEPFSVRLSALHGVWLNFNGAINERRTMPTFAFEASSSKITCQEKQVT